MTIIIISALTTLLVLLGLIIVVLSRNISAYKSQQISDSRRIRLLASSLSALHHDLRITNKSNKRLLFLNKVLDRDNKRLLIVIENLIYKSNLK